MDYNKLIRVADSEEGIVTKDNTPIRYKKKGGKYTFTDDDGYEYSEEDLSEDEVKDFKNQMKQAKIRKKSKKVEDSVDVSKEAEFCVTEDNIYDLIHEGETSVAIPSGADTDAFVKAVEDIIKDVAKECGYGSISVNTEIEGNMLNIIEKK